MGAYLGRLVRGEGFEHGVAVWSSEGWRTRATAWVDERLAEAGLTRTGDLEQGSLRPWACVLRVPSSAGPLWLKGDRPAVQVRGGPV
jgi:hypothetical protein